MIYVFNIAAAIAFGLALGRIPYGLKYRRAYVLLAAVAWALLLTYVEGELGFLK